MYFCFCKQMTAYELRISDGSSDVCSSDLAEMLLDDFLDDRETQASAADTGRHIGFGDPIPFAWEPDAIVDYRDHKLISLLGNGDFHLAVPVIDLAARFDGLGRVLDEIGARLRNLTAVANQNRKFIVCNQCVGDRLIRHQIGRAHFRTPSRMLLSYA